MMSGSSCEEWHAASKEGLVHTERTVYILCLPLTCMQRPWRVEIECLADAGVTRAAYVTGSAQCIHFQ
jgi:hypothetical protein